jgi:signal transduction histidine kinase
VYVPVYDRETGEIIAVAEFYEDASALELVVAAAKLHSWMVTFFVLACNVLAYFAVVHGGSKTIEVQRGQLTQRIDELSQAMSREKALRDQVERGAQKVFDENERFLRALGADLHDGPAQLIGLALLKLDQQGGETDETNIQQARSAITQAMREVRAITAGLLLPDISGQKLEDCIEATVRSHEAKTGTKVSLTCSELAAECPDRVKICVCRFIQEGLANAFRHARGIGQRVIVEGETDFIRVTVADSGPGMPKAYPAENGPHLGLIGLRDRLESVNGTMTVSSRPRHGTRLVARLPLSMEKPNAV